MSENETWNEVLSFSRKIFEFNYEIKMIIIKISKLLIKIEDDFGLKSDEMNNVFECLLDFRHSSLDDLISFIEIVAEEQDFYSYKLLQ